MKKINNLMLASLLMAFAFGVTSCNKDKDDDDVDLSKVIVGIWDYTSHETYIDGKTYREFLIEFFSNNEADLNGDGIINEQDKFDIDAFLGDDDDDDVVEAYIEFKADGSAISYAKYQDGDEDSDLVKYEISGNKLSIIEYEDDEEENEPNVYEISIKGKTLTMKYEEESTFYFDKKKHTRIYISTCTKR
ncbi:MAG: lipocalin family protein [Bacteroidales bacterium]|nr:lipocalin family protein [Bacteroidales bacterium]